MSPVIIPPRFQKLFERAKKNVRAAAQAKCWECSNWQEAEVRDCRVRDCALWLWRPFGVPAEVKPKRQPSQKQLAQLATATKKRFPCAPHITGAMSGEQATINQGWDSHPEAIEAKPL